MSDFSGQQGEKDNPSVEKTTAEDLRSTKLSSLFEDHAQLCDTSMWLKLCEMASEALTSGDLPAQRGFALLATLCTFRIPSDDPAQTWRPRWQDAEKRMLTPADLSGEQILILTEIIYEITNPALRARVADVVWSNDRKQYKAGKEAVDSYCRSINEANLPTKNSEKNDLSNVFELINIVQRALYINGSLGKRNPVPDCLKHAFFTLYEKSKEECIYVAFARLGELAAGYKILTWKEVAEASELLLSTECSKNYPEPRKKAWALAARGYEMVKDMEGRRRCLGKSVDETLRMCQNVSSYVAKASWIRQAITELQIAGGFQNRVADLRIELRDMQLASIDELHPFSIPIDLSEEYELTEQNFSKLNLPENLFKFALLGSSPTMEFLQQTALENKPTGLASLFTQAIYSDKEGKPIAKTSSKISEEGPDEEWYKANSLTTMELFRHTVVESGIKPARYNVMLNFPLEVRHFDTIASLSFFVPYGHEHLYSLGFARFWQGDFASAAYILIPQLENTLRHILFSGGRDSFKFDKEELQEDRSLSGLLENKRSDLEAILGRDIVNEIDLLFHYKPGPSLRHKLAHGKLTASDCYHTSSVYACWFIYRLICLPLLNCWEDQVAPQIEMTL